MIKLSIEEQFKENSKKLNDLFPKTEILIKGLRELAKALKSF